MHLRVRFAAIAIIMAGFPQLTPAQNVLFYNGDINITNGTVLAQASVWYTGAEDYNFLTYDDFAVSGGGWSVSGLFGSLFSEVAFTQAFWEVRQGVSEGDGGTLVANGFANTTSYLIASGGWPDQPIDFWDTHLDLSGAALTLGQGTYWVSIAPVLPFRLNPIGTDLVLAGYVATTGANGVNPLLDQTTYSKSSWLEYGENPIGAYDFSIGVEGSTVPEPATLTLLATGLIGLASSRRRRRQG